MSVWLDAISEVGRHPLSGAFVGPVVVWTALAVLLLGLLHSLRNIHPAVHEKARTALLLALPLSVLLALLGEAGVLSVPQRSAPIVGEWIALADVQSAVTPAAGILPATPSVSPDGGELPMAFWVGLVLLAALFATAYCALKFVLDRRALLRLEKTLRFVEVSELDPGTSACLPRGHRQSNVRFAVAPAGIMPLTYGILRPVVVVPESLLADRDALGVALAHELSHVRRRDLCFHALEHLIAIIFALHPLVHVLRWEIAGFREMACDAEALARYRFRPRDYAKALLRLSELHPACGPSALGVSSTFTQLRRRVAAMNGRNHDPMRLAAARKGGWLTGSTLLLLTTTIAACSDMVSDPPDRHGAAFQSFAAALADAKESREGRLLVYFYSDDVATTANVERYLFGDAAYRSFFEKTFTRYDVKIDSPEAIAIMQDQYVTSRADVPLLLIVLGDESRALTALDDIDSPEAANRKMRQILGMLLKISFDDGWALEIESLRFEPTGLLSGEFMLRRRMGAAPVRVDLKSVNVKLPIR